MLLAILQAVDELASFSTVDGVINAAVEIGRSRLGLERVSFYLLGVSDQRLVLRGTRGTGSRGETTDERACQHEVSREDLRELEACGACGLYLERGPLLAREQGRCVQIALGWSVVMPLTGGEGLLGVMYNDCALSSSPVDVEKQARAAVFCRLVGGLLAVRHGRAQSALPKVGRSSLTRRVLETLRVEPLASGQQLARRFSVSPGHLARTFKRDMGVTLVDYRNRVRMDRFVDFVARGESSILQAVFEAGFGSYSQFHRVHRKMIGTSPRAHVAELREILPADGE